MCKLCELRGKTWNGADPVCAFDNKGMFKENFNDNWNCATLGYLREISYEIDAVVFNNDNNASIISYDANYIFIQWYKSRGRTDYIKIINENINYDSLGVRTDEELCLEIAYANSKDNILDILYKRVDNKKVLYSIITTLIFNTLYNKIRISDEEFIRIYKKIKLNSIYGVFGGSNVK